MFNGMMDPELMRIAQEQMSRMSAADFARIQQQMMTNPDLMRMAYESMQNLRPEDFKQAAERLKHTRPEEMAEIGEKIAGASPDEIAGIRARMDAQMQYEINDAELLKKQGNELHSQGKYCAALQKYMLAKKNLKDVPSSKGRNLLLASSLNMMSCYLKTCQYDECVAEGTEVLAYDANNVKALYRRGQAYKELGQLRDAVIGLRKAHEVSPEDETIIDVLRDIEERLIKEGGEIPPRGVAIEEIIDEETLSSPPPPPQETIQSVTDKKTMNSISPPSSDKEYLEALKNDPDSVRSFQNFISRSDPEFLSSISGGKMDGVSPDMIRTASNVIGKMSPEELQKMFNLASSFQGESTPLKKAADNNFGSVPPGMLKTAADMMGKMTPDDLQKMFKMASSSNGNRAATGALHMSPGQVPSNVTPEMIKTATDMMGKMSPEEQRKMFEMASTMRGLDKSSSTSTSYPDGMTLDSTGEDFKPNNCNGGESASSQGLHSRSIPQSIPFSSRSDLQEQMSNQMKDPAMRQMFSFMMKNMSPELMANMSKQFGFKLSPEEAERAQKAMSSLSPDTLDTMMKWVNRIQRGVEGARKTKSWLLGKPGMIFALLMLVLAVFLHRLGFIGQ